MIKLERMSHQLWRNRYAPSPVMVGDVTLADASNWTISCLSPSLLSALKKGLPNNIGLDSQHNAADLVAAIALRMQLEGDVITPLCGANSRDLQTGI